MVSDWDWDSFVDRVVETVPSPRKMSGGIDVSRHVVDGLVVYWTIVTKQRHHRFHMLDPQIRIDAKAESNDSPLFSEMSIRATDESLVKARLLGII